MKALVCLIGQTRAARIVFDSFDRFVRRELDADLALCHVENQYGTDTPFHRSADYVWTMPPMEDYGDFFDARAGGSTAWHQVLPLRGNWIGSVRGPHWSHGGIIIALRRLLLERLRERELLDHYDRFIVTRPDFFYTCPHPPLALLDPARLWVTDGVQWRGVKDHYACCSRENVADYLDLLDSILKQPEALAELIPATDQYRDENYLSIERYQKLHLMMRGAFDSISLLPEIGYIVREPHDPIGAEPGKYHPSGDYLVKFQHEFDAAARTATLVGDGWRREMLPTKPLA